jgi:hypothetical protein
MKLFAHRLIVSSLGVLLLCTVVLTPTLARAQGTPTQESGVLTLLHNLTTSIASHATALSTAATAGSVNSLSIKEYVLDPLAYTVQKVALQSVTKSVVNWINSGFNGSPAFVTDLNSTLLRVSDTYATNFLNQLNTNTSIRSPFQSQVAQSVRANYFLSTSNDGFFLQNPYTLNQVSPNDAAFLRGDFTQGGWNAWLASIQNPSNNPFGARLLQEQALSGVVGNAVDTQKEELRWSGGFNSFRGTNCGISTGNTRVDVTNLGATAKNIALTTVDNCLFNGIQTSGSVIANAANQYFVNNGLNQYITADEVNEVVGALMGQLVNKVLGNGGLLGVSQPSAGGGRSYIDAAADPTQYTQSTSAASATSLSASFLTTLGNQALALQGYQANWQKISDAATSAKTALQASTCSPSGATTITSQVDPVLAEAAGALANASTALAKLDQIKTALIAAASASGDQTAAVNKATADYQTLMASSAMPTATDIQFSQDQSIDSQDAVPVSLYTQMTQLTAQAACH